MKHTNVCKQYLDHCLGRQKTDLSIQDVVLKKSCMDKVTDEEVLGRGHAAYYRDCFNRPINIIKFNTLSISL